MSRTRQKLQDGDYSHGKEEDVAVMRRTWGGSKLREEKHRKDEPRHACSAWNYSFMRHHFRRFYVFGKNGPSGSVEKLNSVLAKVADRTMRSMTAIKLTNRKTVLETADPNDPKITEPLNRIRRDYASNTPMEQK